MPEHLSQTQLAAYSERTLYPDELLTVDTHLASCDACHERLKRMAPGTAKVAFNPSLESDEGAFHLDYDQHLEPYADGKADDIDREIVESHVALCSKCADDLEDLLAFKEQPVSARPGDSRVKSSRWKQWLRPLLLNPAWATAAVVAVVILAMAVLFWTTYQAPKRVEQAETGSPDSNKEQPALENNQPSPAASVHSAQQSPPSNRSPENEAGNEKPLIVLNDAGSQIVVNQHGRLEGLRELPPDLRLSVENALATRRLRASPGLTGWSNDAGKLRGEFEMQGTFAPLDPTGVVIESDRPAFRWRVLEGARDYTVTVYDGKLRQVATSGPVTGTQWTTPNALERGVTYSWQISALKDGKKVVSPKPPLPEARFRILDRSAAVALAKLKQSAGSSHLAMGVFYWKHGLLEESEREFEALAKANPNTPAVAELLASVRSLRHR